MVVNAWCVAHGLISSCIQWPKVGAEKDKSIAMCSVMCFNLSEVLGSGVF